MDIYLSNVGFKNGFRGVELTELSRLMTASPMATHIINDTMLKPGHPNPVIPAGIEVFRQDRTLDAGNRHGVVAICVNGDYDPHCGQRGEIPDCNAEYLCVTCSVEGSPCVIISAYIKPIELGIEEYHVSLIGKLRELIRHYQGADLIVGGDFYFTTPDLHNNFMAMCAEFGLVEKIGGLTFYLHGCDLLVTKPDYLLVTRSDNYRPAVLSIFGDPTIYAEKLFDHVLVFVQWAAESISASQNVVAVPRKFSMEKKIYYCVRLHCEFAKESGFGGWTSRGARRLHFAAAHEGIPKKNVGRGAVVNPASKHAKQRKIPCEYCKVLFRSRHLAEHVACCSKNPARMPTKKREPRKCPYCQKLHTNLSKHKKICLLRLKPVSRSSSRPRSLHKLHVETVPEMPWQPNEIAAQTPYEDKYRPVLASALQLLKEFRTDVKKDTVARSESLEALSSDFGGIASLLG